MKRLMRFNQKPVPMIVIVVGLLLISIPQSGCTSDVQQNKCANNVQQNKPNRNNEPTSFIIDVFADADSVYYLCSKKFANLIKHPNEERFLEIIRDFNYADKYSESLLYNLVAANKLGISEAKIRVAYCLTQSLSNPYIGKNSKEIALFYLKNGKFATKHKRGKQILERFDSLSADETEFIVPMVSYKSSEIQRLKAGSLKGSVEDYKRLKEKMSNSGMYAFMLYYAYIMADRYNYLPAKKDVVTIINRFYKEYNLVPIDKDTEYFCSFFGETRKLGDSE